MWLPLEILISHLPSPIHSHPLRWKWYPCSRGEIIALQGRTWTLCTGRHAYAAFLKRIV